MSSASTILTVGGELVSRERCASLLADEGYDLVFAAIGPQVPSRAREVRPDVVLLEASEESFDLCTRLRSEPLLSRVPILMAVPADDAEARSRGLAAGADDFVSLPLQADELLPRLRFCARLGVLLRQANERLSALPASGDARLHETLRRRMVELTTLNEISMIITSVLDLSETLGIIAEHAHWLLDAAAASVVLYDQQRGDLWFGAASGEGAEFIRGKRLKMGQGIVNWVIEHGEPLMVADVAQDPRFFGGWDQEMGFTTRSIVCVPLRAKGEVTGAIEAVNKAGGPFAEEDLALLTALAGSAAIAIENARLYGRAQQEIAERTRVEEELRRLNRELESIVAERTRSLQAERDRTQAILEAVGEAVIVTDLEGRIQYLNPAALALTGYSLEEALGQTPPSWQPEALAADAGPQGVAPGTVQVRRIELVSRRKDGSLYDALTTIAPLFDAHAGEQPIGYVSVQRDITPIKEAERLKDQFISNVSHELRTPLSVITLVSGNLDLLYDHLSDEQRRKMVRDIRQHAQVLEDLVGDVLELSRVESGRLSMDRGPLDLARLVREEVEKQAPLAQKKAHILRAIADQPLNVTGNEDQLRQVIRNLVNNAIKYTPQGGQITCECALLVEGVAPDLWPGSLDLPGGKWAALRVADTGVGIGAEDVPRVFERFYRVKSQGQVPGTGLGLAIAKELVEAHGGRIALASAVGEGSVFAVYLPWQEE